MLLLITLIFSVLAYVNYRLSGKALIYPPVAFCAIWAFDLFLAWVVGDFFYPMLAKTLGIFLCGGLVFSLGCWAAILMPELNPPAKPAFHLSSDRIITLFFFIVVIGAPFFCRWIFGLVSANGGTGAFLLLARMSIIEEMGKNLTFTVFGTLSEIALIVALMAFYERAHHPKRAVLAITMSLGMGILLGQKVGPLSLVVGMICIEWIRTRRINWKFLVVLLLIFVTATGTIELYVHVGGDSLQEKVVPVFQNFVLYASGGMIGFDRVVRDPNIVPGINPFYVIYQRILRRLGMYEQIPEVAEFVAIGPHSLVENVYTMYWEYLFLGYLGAILFTGLIGFLLTLIFKRAMQGGKICIFLYAFLFRGVVFAPFTDYFLNLYFLFKVLILVWFVYSFPVRWAQFTTLIGRTGPPKLAKSQ